MTDNTKAMEEALQAAVQRMNATNGGDTGMPTDPIGLLAAILPKLMASQGENQEDQRDVLLEKLEGLQKEGIGGLSEQVTLLRKQVHRVFKEQEQLLAHLREVEKRQVDVSQAVLELARQMARVQIIEPLSDDDAPAPAPPPNGRTRPPADRTRSEPGESPRR